MGHTSIAVLQKSYFDYVKIDGSLIKDISNERSRSIISSVMHLGEELNFKVVAECVESAEQRDALAALGCEICQGYFFSKPVTEDRLKEMLSEHGK